MLNNVSPIGRAPAFGALVVEKRELNTKALELAQQAKTGNIASNLIGDFTVEHGEGKKAGNKPLNGNYIIKSEIIGETPGPDAEKTLARTLKSLGIKNMRLIPNIDIK